MLTVHLGCRVPADLATALAIMARERGTSLSQEYRAAVTRHLRDWAREDDEPAGTGSVVGSTDSPKRATSDAVPAA